MRYFEAYCFKKKLFKIERCKRYVKGLVATFLDGKVYFTINFNPITDPPQVRLNSELSIYRTIHFLPREVLLFLKGYD